MTRRPLALVLVLAACARPAAAAPPQAAPSTPPAPAHAPPRVVSRATPSLPMLSTVPLEVADDVPARLRDARFEMQQRDGTWAPITPVTGEETAPAPTPAHRAASFFVDFDQDPLRALCGADAMTPDEVLTRTDAVFPRKSLAYGYLPASTGASHREGDCTEHATVAAALLRCHGHPARLAVGVLVVRLEGRWLAGGHMWAERYDGAWRVADATRPERHGEPAYLRTAVVEDEGPGGALSLSGLIQRTRLSVRVSAPR